MVLFVENRIDQRCRNKKIQCLVLYENNIIITVIRRIWRIKIMNKNLLQSGSGLDPLDQIATTMNGYQVSSQYG